MLSIQILAVLAAAVSASSLPRTHEHLHHKYDYVVVGSGAGGGPLASRLAIAGHKVLLIEAGDDEGHAIDQQVPALHLQSTEYTPMKWDYFVHHYADQTRQKKDTKMVYKTTGGKLYTGLSPPKGAEPLGVLYPRAGTLGGCGAHNALITVLPFDKDWTYIQELTGDDSWSPANMRDYFKRLEKNEYLPAGSGHGYKGWLKTSLTSLSLVIKDLRLLSLIISAATAQGKGLLGGLISTVTGLANVLTADLNSETPWRDTMQNVYQVPIAVDNDILQRNSPREFILKVANAVNDDGSRKYHLDIWLKTLATKIRFDTSGDTPKAIGVEYIQGQSLYAADPRYAAAKGTPGYVAAKKEVIISAGAFNTPQLLKLSGIGPKAELKKFGIKVIKDLPGVGTNLQDRYETGVIGRNPGEFVITKDCTFGYTLPDPCLDQWKSGTTKDGKGTYATNGIAIAITKRSTAAADEDPDVLITGAPAAFKGYYPDYARIGLQDANHWTWIILKAHARNTAGTVKLRSANPQDVPEITMHYFDEGSGAWQDDLQAVVEGMEWARTAYADLIPLQGRYTEVWPGENVTDDALKDFIQNEAWGHHASCTAAIGKDGDPMAVLDSKFRVRGVKRLRVVDAAAFPKIPGYYIALPTYMISEKAADVILGKAHQASEEDDEGEDGGSGISISL